MKKLYQNHVQKAIRHFPSNKVAHLSNVTLSKMAYKSFVEKAKLRTEKMKTINPDGIPVHIHVRSDEKAEKLLSKKYYKMRHNYNNYNHERGE